MPRRIRSGSGAAEDGAHERNRTFDLLLTKEVLYRLSYVSNDVEPGYRVERSMERETGIEPAPSAWKAEVLPLNYSRTGTRLPHYNLSHCTCFHRTRKMVEGGGFEPPKA